MTEGVTCQKINDTVRRYVSRPSSAMVRHSRAGTAAASGRARVSWTDGGASGGAEKGGRRDKNRAAHRSAGLQVAEHRLRQWRRPSHRESR